MDDAGSDEAIFRQAAERFSEHLDEITDEAIAAYRAEIPAYAGIDSEQMLAELRGSFRSHAVCFLAAIVENRSLTEGELEAMATLGPDRLGRGLALADLVGAYGTGTRASLARYVAILGRLAPDPAERLRLGEEATQRALRVSSQASRAFSGAC